MKHTTIALVLALLPALAGAEIYKWVDKDGRVRFSDKPPPEQQAGNSEKVELRTWAPGTDDAVLDTYKRTERLFDAKDKATADADQANAEQQRANAARNAAHKDACFEARDRQRKLSGPVVFVDEYGKPVKASDNERKQELAEVGKWIAANCP